MGAPGDLDPHFGTRGLTTVDAGGYDEMAAMAVDGSKIIAAGRVFRWENYSMDLVVTRFREDGRRDRSFGDDGLAIVDMATDLELSGGITPLATGGYMLAGSVADADGDPNSWDMVLIRLTRSGRLDKTFAGDGIHRFDVNLIDFVEAMALQPDGKILLAGRSGGPSDILTVVRVHPNGVLDTASDDDPLVHFSEDGKAFIDAGGSEQSIEAMALQPDGKVVVAGRSGAPEDTDMVVARLNGDGSLDTDFGILGMTHLDRSASESFTDVALQSNGRIVVVGGSELAGEGSRGVIARYTPAGEPDASFGTSGRIEAPAGDAYFEDQVGGVVIQRDGKIVVGGALVKEDDPFFAWNYFMRLLPSNGGRDPSFGRWTPGFRRFAKPNQHMFGDLLRSRNRIILGGQVADQMTDFFVLAVVARVAPSTTTLRTRKSEVRIKARGAVWPKHPGKKVSLTLQKRKRGHFVTVARKRATLNAYGRYFRSFERPSRMRRCRVVTKFPGDAAHKPSSAKRTFRC